MPKDSEYSVNDNSPPKDSDSDRSFVKKVKSRVSGFLPSSISKWFGNSESHVRQRDELDDDDDDDDESFTALPPSKRVKSNEADITAPSFQISSVSTPMHYPNAKNKYSNDVNCTEKKITSLFPEPVAGPSGIQSRKFTPAKTIDQNRFSIPRQQGLNGDKYSDSGESTSGYSSMMRMESKERVIETNKTVKSKPSSTVNNSKQFLNTSLSVGDRSLFNERSLSQQVNSSLSTRQPAFSASVFGSPNFIDRTLSSKRIMNSPFYNGRTIYGGASAYGRHLAKPSTDVRSSVRNSVQIKPINEKIANENISLSKTARRILDTLEQYTTPVAEAKKIPHPSRRNFKYSTASPYVLRNNKLASNKELQVPTVPDLLQMKLKERLQDSTVSVRQIATSSKSTLNTEEYKIRIMDEDASKHTNKMKNKVSSVRQKVNYNENVEELKLPEIQLPISTLPKFDFSLPIQTKPTNLSVKPKSETIASTSSNVIMKNFEKSSTRILQNTNIEILKTLEKKKIISMESNKKEIPKTEPKSNKCSTSSVCTDYKFADPLIIAENLKVVKAINNFIFSEPVSAKKTKSSLEVDMSSNFKGPESTSVTLKKIVPRTNEESHIPSVKETVTSGSVLDVLKPTTNQNNIKPVSDTSISVPKLTNQIKFEDGFGNKFKIKSNQWECKECMVVNSSEKNTCVACESPKTNTTECTKGFGNSFKLTSDKWECNDCFVRNNIADNKCIACGKVRAATFGSAEIPTFTPLVQTSSSFGDKFKPSSNTWECGTCMIRNKSELLKCAACETPKPGCKTQVKESGFGNNFKKKSNEWECDSCMVKNASDKIKCQCCETPKPGSTPVFGIPKEKSQLSSFNFGIDKSSTTNVQGFTFGIKATDNNGLNTQKSLIFGQGPPTSATTTTFSFGIKPIQENKDTPLLASQMDKQKLPETKQSASTTVTSSNVSSPLSLKRTSTDNTNDNIVMAKRVDLGLSSASETTIPKVTESSDKLISLNGDINKLDSASFESTEQSKPNKSITFSSNIGKENTPVTTTALFAFGAKTTVTTQPTQSLFSSNTNKQPALQLNTTDTKTSIIENTPMFNSPNLSVGKATLENINAPGFGPAINVPTFQNSTSMFGGETQEPKAFNANKEPLAAPTQQFTFAQQSKSADLGKLFNFGPPDTNTLGSGFNFAPNTTQPNAGFNFSTTHQPTNDVSFNNVPQAVPQNGIFNFGTSANNTPKTGFHFGANHPTPSAVNNQGLFNFGIPTNMPPAGSSGFNFGTSSVNPELKPTINFTGGHPAPTFNAQANPDKPRVIRKAFRRTQR